LVLEEKKKSIQVLGWGWNRKFWVRSVEEVLSGKQNIFFKKRIFRFDL